MEKKTSLKRGRKNRITNACAGFWNRCANVLGYCMPGQSGEQPPGQRTVFFFLSLALLGVALCSFIYAYHQLRPLGVIEVTGYAWLPVQPDSARLSINVTGVVDDTDSVSEVVERVENTVNAIQDTLLERGVPKDNIHNISHYVGQRRDTSSRRGGRFSSDDLDIDSDDLLLSSGGIGTQEIVSHRIVATVSFDELDLSPEDIQAIVESASSERGGPEVSVSTHLFVNEKEMREIKRKTLVLALADARNKIRFFEKHVGVDVVGLKSLTQQGRHNKGYREHGRQRGGEGTVNGRVKLELFVR